MLSVRARRGAFPGVAASNSDGAPRTRARAISWTTRGETRSNRVEDGTDEATAAGRDGTWKGRGECVSGLDDAVESLSAGRPPFSRTAVVAGDEAATARSEREG